MAPQLMWLIKVNGSSPDEGEKLPSLNSECFEGKLFPRDAVGAQIPSPTAWKRSSQRRVKPSFSSRSLGGGTIGGVSCCDLELILS
jgi:hypothetical protein